MQTAPEPKSLLGHYKVSPNSFPNPVILFIISFKSLMPSSPHLHIQVLSPHAGVRVSPLCLGAMNFGDKWTETLGECTKEEAFKIMDTFYEGEGFYIVYLRVWFCRERRIDGDEY